MTNKVDRFLEKNYGNAALTVQEVADNLGFTYTYLCSAYKKSCGKQVAHHRILTLENLRNIRI